MVCVVSDGAFNSAHSLTNVGLDFFRLKTPPMLGWSRRYGCCWRRCHSNGGIGICQRNGRGWLRSFGRRRPLSVLLTVGLRRLKVIGFECSNCGRIL